MDLIAQGAEAHLYKKDESTLLKIREPKPYRHEHIDHKLRLFRTRREFKVLTRLKEQEINVPTVKTLDETTCSFELEYISGPVLKQALSEDLLKQAFQTIIKIHKEGVVHGDLTTLNMIVHENNVYIIDFGLAEFSEKKEQRAVDLNLFFTCIKNEHPNSFSFKEELLTMYNKESFGEEVIERLEQLEHRGRNK